MTKEAPGKIYLSDQRGQIETAKFSRYSIFNFGGFYNEHKVPFGTLYAFNEETLATSQSVSLSVIQATYLIVIPITGAIKFRERGNSFLVDVEEVQVCYMPANTTFTVTNPYETDFITYIQIWIKAEQEINESLSQLFKFNFDSIENNLSKIISEVSTVRELPFAFSIGRFGGRQEAIYKLENKNSLFFASVIAGAFELEGRLLHAGDSIALWNIEEAELEALSNNALVLVLEIFA